MADPNNALSWSQSSPQFAQPQSFDQAQPSQDYHAALSDAWHRSYSQNNPADYEANYRAPSKYEPDYAGGSDMMLNPALAGLNEADPAGAQGRANLQAGGLKSMVTGAFPAISALAGGLMPTPLNAGEPKPQQANRVTELDDLISQETQRMNAALKAAETHNVTNSGTYKAGNRSKKDETVPPDEEQSKRISAPFLQKIGNYQTERQTLMPWSQTGPEWERAAVKNAPAIAAASGLAAGLLTKNPYAAMAFGGVSSGLEGFLTSTWPTANDLQLPENSPAGQEARKNWDSWDWWRRGPITQTLETAGLGAVGAKFGNMGRQGVGQLVSGARNLLSGSSQPNAPTPNGNALNAAAPSAPAIPQALSREPLFTDPRTGKPVFMGAQGKQLRTNKNDEWIDHANGRRVSKSDHPLWFQADQQGNALNWPPKP